MFKTTIMDSIKKLVKGDGTDNSDKPDQRIQKIHLLLDNAEKNIDISNEKNPQKNNAAATKQPNFGREAYHENLARLEKEIFNISAMKNAKRARPKHNNISAEVSDLAKELDAVKRALLDYGETTEVILRGVSAEKMPELEKLSAHDKEINAIKSELLKSVRVTDAVASDKKELEKRINKIESAQILWRDSESRMRQIIDDAVKNMPAQRDYSGINNSVIELKKGLLELRGEIEAPLEEFPENLMQLKKEVSKLKDAQMNKSVQSPETERLSGKLNYLEKEFESVKKALIDYDEKISSFDSSLSAKKIPELKMLRAHDKELIYLKSEILKSARIKDDIASERKEFDKRLKKVESAQTSEIEYNALIQNAVDAAMREIHAQKDHKGIKGSISELRKEILAIKDNIEKPLEEYPENMMQLKKELSRLKSALAGKSNQSPETERISRELNSLEKEIVSVKKTLLEYCKKTESLNDSITAEKLPELEKLAAHERNINVLKSEILKSARIKDDIASERKEFDKRLKKIEAAQTSEIEYTALIQDAVDAAMRKIHAQKDHKGIKGISELKKDIASMDDDFQKRIKKIEGVQNTWQDIDARIQKAVGDAMQSTPMQKDQAIIKNSISELKKNIAELRDELDAELSEYPENLAKLKAEVSKLKEVQKIRDLRSLKEGKSSSEMFAMAKELAIIKKTLLEHSKTIESLLTDITAANEAVGQNRIILESIPAEISNAKNDEVVARENEKALLEEEISGMRADLGGIKGIVESLKNAKKAKTKKAKKHAVHKHHAHGRKKDKILRRNFKGGLLQTLREYTNEENMRTTKRKSHEIRRAKRYSAKQAAIQAAASKSSSGNPEYVELKLAIENKSRELKIHRQNNKQNQKQRRV